MNVNGVEYNVDRIMRVIISESNPVNQKSLSQKDKEKQQQWVIEYCPMADERLNARIEVTEKEIPIINSKRNGPGSSAKIKIYNPPVSLVASINQHIGWSFQNNSLDAYYAGRLWVTIDAGYWNRDFQKVEILDTDSAFAKQEKQDINTKGSRDYKNLFAGWLNTSAYYRKGVDNVLELFCHSIRITDRENQELVSAAYINRQKYAGVTNYQQLRFEEKKNSVAVGRPEENWDVMIHDIIKKHAKLKAPKTPYGALQVAFARNATLAPVDVTESDRQTGKFFYVNYIYEPSNYTDVEGVKRVDESLRNMAQGNSSMEGIVINGQTFEDMIQQMCDKFPGGPLRWHQDFSYNDGYTRYYFWWPKGTRGRNLVVPSSTPVTTKPDVIIYNFQNFLEVPSIDGAGQLTIKMLFNPNIKTNNALELRWVDNLAPGASVISPLTKGIQTTAQLGQYYPSLQAGVYSTMVAAILNTNGELFNIPYTVGYITHTLSTHSNTWQTEIKTTAIALKPRGK